MNREAHSQNLAFLNINPDEIENEQHAKAFNSLFAIIKIINEENIAQKEQIQVHRDEINLLRGEQIKPNIRVSKKNDDISSEDERKQREPQKNRESNSRKEKIEIHRAEACKVDGFTSPGDAVFKGYSHVVIRDIIVKPWNTKYLIEHFYSPSENKIHSGKIPNSVKGEFGAGLITFILTLYHIASTSEPKIHEYLESIGILISKSTISRIITENNDLFHKEKAEIFQAGLNSTAYQQIDDTSARVNGSNCSTSLT